MPTDSSLPVPEPIARRAENFVGRRATVERIATWLDSTDPFLCLTGDPGTGKSALLAWLAGAGRNPADQELGSARTRISQSLDHAHFCIATSPNDPSLDPWLFSRDLGRQLAIRDNRLGLALAAALGPQISVVQSAGSVQTQIGAQIGVINIADAASLFNVVAQSLKKVADQDPDRSFVVAIDSLDEAELWPSAPRIGELGLSRLGYDAPSNLRFLLSCRPSSTVLDRLPAGARWDIVEDAPADRGDVAEYVSARIHARAPEADPRLADRIARASENNFLYAEHALDYWLPRLGEMTGVDDLELPPGLDAIYGLFLEREFGTPEGRRQWEKEIRPLLATVGAAREPLNRPLLSWLLGIDDETLGDRLRVAQQYLAGDLPNGPFGIYHQSFREFLFDPDRNASFKVSAASANERIGRRFVETYDGMWEATHDRYGLRHTVTHLAEAARESSQPTKHELAGLTASVALSASFQAAYESELGDPSGVVAAVASALETAAQDDDPRAATAVVRIGLATTAVRKRLLRPESVFEVAATGDLTGAERRLASFPIEEHWNQAAQLACAWLATEANHQGAADLLGRVRAALLSYYPLTKLGERVAVDAEGGPMPELSELDFPPEHVVRTIVDRLGGTNLAVAPSVLAEYAPSGEDVLDGWLHASESAWGAGPDYAPILAAQVEAPLLVGFAHHAPDPGNEYFDRYVTLHAANDYVHYRNRSLWSILEHAVQHPDQTWVRRRLVSILSGAMAGSRLNFAEAVPLTILALDPNAVPGEFPDFDAAVADATGRAGLLVPGSDREGDAWSEHKRRLGALAEAAKRIKAQEPTARHLLDMAIQLPFGFAGFQAPGCLTLAESIQVVDATDLATVRIALNQAETASHNIQDPLLCARVTARVAAMTRWWWPEAEGAPSFDLEAVVTRMVENPETPEFNALHIVGESYRHRDTGPGSMPLPGTMRDARTLRDIARVHERTLSEVQRLNDASGWGVDDRLDDGTKVSIPDGELLPLIASRLSAACLAAPGLSAKARVRLLQLVAPAASRNVTTLDTVLARLLIAASPNNLADLGVGPVGSTSTEEEDAARYGTVAQGIVIANIVTGHTIIRVENDSQP